MNKPETLKPCLAGRRARIKIKFKYFILAHMLTLFFALAPASLSGGPNVFAADLPADEGGNFFDFSQETSYSEPFSKLIDFLNEKKKELENYDSGFLSEENFSNDNNSADEINPAVSSFASAVFDSVKSFVVDNPKQYFGTVFESVKNFVFPGPNQNDFKYNSPTSLSAEEAGESAAREMENLKQQYSEAIDEAKAISQKFSLLQNEMEKIKNSGVVVRQPVIEQRAVEKTIEKIVSGLSQADLDSGLSSLKTELQNLNTNLTTQINNLSAQTNKQTAATYQTISLTNKIDSLTNTAITTPTISNPTITGILTNQTLSNSGNATISGALGVSGLATFANSTTTNGTITDNFWSNGSTYIGDADADALTIRSGAWSLTSTATSTVAMTNGLNFDSNTFIIDPNSNRIGIGTSSPYAKLSVAGPVAAEYFHATSTAATSTFSGQTVAGFAPTWAHSFGSWSVGASGANPLGASLVINPSSAVADSNLLSLSVNGSAKFLVDAEGDVFANAVTVVGGTTLSTTTASTFTVEGNIILGDATTTDITYFNSRIADSLFPTADNYLDLGDSTNWLRWRTGYFGTSVGIGGAATSTGSQLTTSGAYLIDSNGTLSINTTNNKAVSFGNGNVVLPYASSTALTISGSAYIGSLNGPLQANNGLVSATTSVGTIYGGTGINSSALTGIAQIVSGTWSASSTLSTAFGGTGWGNLQANTVLLGNGAGRLATTSAGTDGYVLALSAGVPTWIATSTLSTITGTLAVAKGGTGQTSFGQGWLNSDGTTLSASTSPTVNYITATSTTATSTFAGGLSAAGSSGLTVLQNGNVGIGTTSPEFKLTLGQGTSTPDGGILSIGTLNSGATLATAGAGTRMIWYPKKAAFRAGWVEGTAWDDANIGLYSTAVGNNTKASGSNSFATGVYSLASGGGSNAFGYFTTASADWATVFGQSMTVSGAQSFGINLDGNTQTLSQANTMAIMGGNIGIGTTSPYAKLSVVGETVSSYFTATSTTATSTFPYLSVTTNSNLGTVVGGTWQGTAVGAQYGGTGINSSALTGLAQIVSGTWSASSTLSTAFGGTGWGNLQANTVLLGNGAGRLATTSAGTDGYVLALSAGVPTWIATSTLSTITGTLAVAKGGTGATTLTGLLQGNGTSAITGITGTAGQFPYYNGTDTLLATSSLFLATSGNVGIGTAGPNQQLEITKSFRMPATTDSTTGVIYKGANSFIHTFTPSIDWPESNTFVGVSAGNFTMTAPSPNLGARNTGIGNSALKANTTGRENNAIGMNALLSNTTGDFNTADGMNALQANTTGNENTALGMTALYSNTTGYNNVAVGSNVARSITTGNSNVFIGSGTGYNELQKVDAVNSMALGSGAYTTADNQVVIGNTSVTQTLLKGNIGIGTTSPYAKLSVVGETVSSYFTATSTTATSTFPYLSVTTNSNLGTVVGGTWQGTAVGAQYGGTGINSSALTGLAQIVSGTWSASSTLSAAFGGTGWGNLQANTVLLGNGAGRLATTSAGTDGYVLALSAGVPTWLATSTLSTITGTLTVAKGGTGQTSFGQGWLNSDGTTLSASTSPTVNYITATSTTATSTFAGGMNVAGSSGLTVLQNGKVGIGTTTPAYPLDVGGDFRVGEAGSTNALFVDATFGNAAIGHPSNADDGFLLPNRLSGDTGGVLTLYDLGASEFPSLELIGNPSSVGGQYAQIKFGRYTGGSGAANEVARIESLRGTADQRSVLAFYTTAASLTEKMRIDENGNIGIGTTSPQALLTVGSSTPAYLPAANKYNSAYVSGLLEVGGTGTSTFAGFIDVLGTGANATSTISGNLWVKGALRAATSYVGDLIFANNFRFTEADPILTGSNALYLQNQFGSTTLAIDENGNVGVGTTSPAYKLQVMGDIAATSFINTSTREAKKDINYLTASQETDFLNKIKNTNIANYHYNVENQTNPLRLGLIAEEAPAEILSVDGKGVDVYKMATFTLGGVKALQKEIEKMKIDLAALSANSAASSGTGSDGLFAWIIEKFKTALGIGFERGKICLEDICVNKTQLKELLEKNNISQTSSSSSSSSAGASSSSLSSGASSESSSSSESVSSSSSSSESLSSSLPVESSSSSETISVSSSSISGQSSSPSETASSSSSEASSSSSSAESSSSEASSASSEPSP